MSCLPREWLVIGKEAVLRDNTSRSKRQQRWASATSITCGAVRSYAHDLSARSTTAPDKYRRTRRRIVRMPAPKTSVSTLIVPVSRDGENWLGAIGEVRTSVAAADANTLARAEQRDELHCQLPCLVELTSRDLAHIVAPPNRSFARSSMHRQVHMLRDTAPLDCG